ncbi:MAG: S41 family peptidase [Anaerolineales bacterium]|jgi:carboxyl-terminal processing protease
MLDAEVPTNTDQDSRPTEDTKRGIVTRSTVIGVWSLAAVLALLLAGLTWLRTDPRFSPAAGLTAAARLVFERSVAAADPDKVFEAAARGMMSALDPYSMYLSPREFELFQSESEGEYVGIGAEVQIVNGFVTIFDVYPQSPAADALLRPGDRIMSIDGTSTEDLDLGDVLELMHGEIGTTVQLEIETSGLTVRELTLTRRPIIIEPFPIVGETRSGIGYVRWAQFSIGAADRLAAIVEEFNIEEPIGLILDLRGNPGGVLSEAVAAAGLFLPSHSDVCTLVDSRGSESFTFETSAIPSVYHGPLVIVQDDMTASSAEVLAAALQDAGRAVIVGQRSFGKGWVQSIFPLDDGGAIRLSTARYTTPSGTQLGDPAHARALYDSVIAGRPWTGIGLVPDIEVPETPADAWVESLLHSGLLLEFVAKYVDDWPATGAYDSELLIGELHKWLKRRPHAFTTSAADSLLASLQSNPDRWQSARLHASCIKKLKAAIKKEILLLRKREHPQLLRYLWEQRLLGLGQVDPGELEALLDADPDLATARDLLEQPERYNSVIE